jgi:uncharacterized protein YbjT (DUF2867 family)
MSKKENRAVLFGGTGLIGGYLLEELIKDPQIDKIVLVGRREPTIDHFKLSHRTIDLNDHSQIADCISKDSIVFSAIGTTAAAVSGDLKTYRSIDYDITLNIARSCQVNKARRFLYVSSSGANAQSKNFYLGLKGEIDDQIAALNLASAIILRPSLLLGKRKELRLGEKIGQLIMPLLKALLPLRLHPIKAQTVARCMIILAKSKYSGTTIIENAQILGLKPQESL